MRRRWLGAPGVHFAALGALVFAVQTWRATEVPPATAGIAAPSDQELLEREARRLGLGRDDSAVRRRLVRNLRFLGEGNAAGEEADYEEALALGLDRSDLVVGVAWSSASSCARSPGRARASPRTPSWPHCWRASRRASRCPRACVSRMSSSRVIGTATRWPPRIARWRSDWPRSRPSAQPS
jgi:hypothetical protein